MLCSADDDLLLVSAEGQSIRFHATDEALRPMGRATSGVLGMRFNAGDELLSMDVVQRGRVRAGRHRAAGTPSGPPIEEYPVQGRGGKGVLTLQYDRRRGKLVGALIVELDDEVYAITSSGGVIRTPAQGGPQGRAADDGSAADEPGRGRHAWSPSRATPRTTPMTPSSRRTRSAQPRRDYGTT